MAVIWWGIGIGGALYGLHRLLLWMESHGWVFYMKKRASGSALGAAFLEIQSFVEPDAKHAIEAQRVQKTAQDDASESK